MLEAVPGSGLHGWGVWEEALVWGPGGAHVDGGHRLWDLILSHRSIQGGLLS